MQNIFVVTLIIALLMPLFFIICKIKWNGPYATIAKTYSSFCFILLSVILYWQYGSGVLYGIFVIVGLLFGLFGDVFLDLQDPNVKPDSPFLFAGIGSFMTEHIIILTAFSLHIHDVFKPIFLVISIVCGLIFSLGFTAVEKQFLKFEFGKSIVLVVLYSFILATCFIYYLIYSIIDPKYLVMFVGIALFLLSDSVLSVMYFHEKNKSHLLLLVNIITYYYAQILFALSILFL